MTGGRVTGPRTPEGKSIACRNAVRHGVLSRMQVLPDEDEGVFAEFRDRMLAALCPRGDLELLLADRAVLLAWRLQRIMRLEVAILASYYFQEMESRARAEVARYETDPLASLIERDPIISDPKARDVAVRALAEVRDASQRRDDGRLGRAFIRDASEIEALAKLSRYETALERSLYRTLGELRRLRSADGRDAGIAVRPDPSGDTDRCPPSDGSGGAGTS